MLPGEIVVYLSLENKTDINRVKFLMGINFTTARDPLHFLLFFFFFPWSTIRIQNREILFPFFSFNWLTAWIGKLQVFLYSSSSSIKQRYQHTIYEDTMGLQCIIVTLLMLGKEVVYQYKIFPDCQFLFRICIALNTVLRFSFFSKSL